MERQCGDLDDWPQLSPRRPRIRSRRRSPGRTRKR